MRKKIMSELTTADRFELVDAQYRKTYLDDRDAEWFDVTDDVSIDRWSKYGKDRLYINGLKTGDGWLSIKTGESGGDKWTKVSADYEIEGDELTITVGNKRPSYKLTIRVHGDGFEAADKDEDESEDEEETKLLADGGEDGSDLVSDKEIEARIDQHDDPEHPDANSAADVRDALAAVERELFESIDEYDDSLPVAHEDSEAIIYVQTDRHDLDLALDAAGVDEDILRTIVNGLMHDAARARCDREWSADYPLVVRKPARFRDAERHALRSLGRTIADVDSPRPTTKGVDSWATHIHGLGYSEWATMSGSRDRSNVRTNALAADQ